MRFVIEGEPVGKGRPRVTARHGYAHAYTPARTKHYEDHVRNCFNSAAVGVDIDADAPKAVTVVCVFGLPKNTPKKRVQERLSEPVLKRPDIDNVVKAVLDALSGLAWNDDKQVVRISVFKVWGLSGRVIVEVKDLDRVEHTLMLSEVMNWTREY